LSPDPVPPADADVAPFARLDRCTKTYAMGATRVHALDGVSLAIPQGQFVAVVGPSGSGKSTLLHLLAALDRPSQGSVRVGEWQLDALSADAQARYRRTMVGILFQQFHLIPTMTARENVALPMVLAGVAPDDRSRRAADCLDMVDLADRMDHRPTELSGGEQQRVATARALVGDPPLLLADEPTGNLDTETGARMIDLLAQVHRDHGRTVLVATHHPEELEGVAERIVHLQDGAVCSEG
jgi:ABC-type lipoprotein export system ATPase subunit